MKKNVTISDVAKQVGVSKSTISRYLNGRYGNMSEATRLKIEQTIKAMNYRPSKQAQALKSKKSHLIGVLIADISNMYSSILLKGMGDIFVKHNYQTIIMDAANSLEKEKELLEKLIDQGVEGLVIQPCSSDNSNYDFLQNVDIPIIFVDRPLHSFRWPVVTTDNIQSIERLCANFDLQSYRQIVVITEPITNIITRKLRYQTLERIAQRAQISFKLLETELNEQFDLIMEQQVCLDGRDLWFATNGRTLMQCLTFLIDRKINIPNQVSITGFDDWNLTGLVGPGITSIEQPTYKIGFQAAKNLMDILQENITLDELGEQIIPSVIKIRKSVRVKK